MKQLFRISVHFIIKHVVGIQRWSLHYRKKWYLHHRLGSKTVHMIDDAYNFIRDIAVDGGNVLFLIGTKNRPKKSIKEEAGTCWCFLR